MMGVVEQQREAAAVAAQTADAGDQTGWCPFVDDNDVGVVEHGFVVEIGPEGLHMQVRIVGQETRQRGGALIRDEVDTAPAGFRLQHQRGMAAPLQFAQDAAQEMGVAVVPVGHNGMCVEDEFHIICTGAASPEYSSYRRATCPGRLKPRARQPASSVSVRRRAASDASMSNARDQP